MPNKNNQRNSPKLSQLQRQIASLKSSVNGRTLRPKGDPSPVTSKPWNTLTILASIAATSHTFTVASLSTLIQQQIGLPTSVKPEFKLISVQMWCKLPAVTIGMDIYSADDIDAVVLASLFDRGSGTNLGAVGYQFPAAHSRRVLYGATEETRTIATYTTSEGGVEARFRVLWRIR
jgi:hypothetical protein